MATNLIVGNSRNNTTPDYRHGFNTPDGAIRVNTAANVNFSLAIPIWARVAYFSYRFTSVIWVSPTAIAGIPGMNSFDVGSFKLNPAVHAIEERATPQTLNFFSITPVIFLVSFYRK